MEKKARKRRSKAFLPQISSDFWEVLNGVGVDGVGGIFPFFDVCVCFFFFSFSFFFDFLFFVSLFFVLFRFLRFSLILLEDKGARLQFPAKMGNFTPTPSALTPCKTQLTICLSLLLLNPDLWHSFVLDYRHLFGENLSMHVMHAVQW